jgi:hypothetical protein
MRGSGVFTRAPAGPRLALVIHLEASTMTHTTTNASIHSRLPMHQLVALDDRRVTTMASITATRPPKGFPRLSGRVGTALVILVVVLLATAGIVLVESVFHTTEYDRDAYSIAR